MSDKIEAKVTHRFAQPPEQVYAALVEPESVRAWQLTWLLRDGATGELTRFEHDPRVGGAYDIAGTRNGEESRSWGRFLALEPPTRLSYSFIVEPEEEEDPSVVTIIIEPEPDGPGSIVTLYNTMDAEWSDWLPQTERAWMHMLQAVDQVLSGA